MLQFFMEEQAMKESMRRTIAYRAARRKVRQAERLVAERPTSQAFEELWEAELTARLVGSRGGRQA
jgi:hypothetical protein